MTVYKKEFKVTYYKRLLCKRERFLFLINKSFLRVEIILHSIETPRIKRVLENVGKAWLMVAF